VLKSTVEGHPQAPCPVLLLLPGFLLWSQSHVDTRGGGGGYIYVPLHLLLPLHIDVPPPPPHGTGSSLLLLLLQFKK